jgi:hypothetical protein
MNSSSDEVVSSDTPARSPSEDALLIEKALGTAT